MTYYYKAIDGFFVSKNNLVGVEKLRITKWEEDNAVEYLQSIVHTTLTMPGRSKVPASL